MLLDYDKILSFLTDACTQYEKTAPTVHSYCEDLYERVSESQLVQLEEIRLVSQLRVNNIWATPNQAANIVYHIQDRLGMKTTGHAGF